MHLFGVVWWDLRVIALFDERVENLMTLLIAVKAGFGESYWNFIFRELYFSLN